MEVQCRSGMFRRWEATVAVELKSPMEWLTGQRSSTAEEDLSTYMAKNAGRHFDRLVSRTDPNRFEAEDLIAVWCLSVPVPAETAAWLLLDAGASECSKLLARMPDVSAHIADVDPASDEAANELWTLLIGRHKVGETTASKLMAAKRPNLIPIVDAYMRDALLQPPARSRWSWWQPWHQVFTGRDGTDIRRAVESLRLAVPEATELSDLRILDIVIWMSEDRRRRAARSRK